MVFLVSGVRLSVSDWVGVDYVYVLSVCMSGFVWRKVLSSDTFRFCDWINISRFF